MEKIYSVTFLAVRRKILRIGPPAVTESQTKDDIEKFSSDHRMLRYDDNNCRLY